MTSLKIGFCGALLLCVDQVEHQFGWTGVVIAGFAAAVAYSGYRALKDKRT